MYGYGGFMKKKLTQTVRKKRISDWELRFIEKLGTVHKRNVEVKAKKLMRKTYAAMNSMNKRSADHGVECSITLDEIRELTYAAYGTNCKYSSRQLTLENIVYDHVIPISKGGPSTKDNIQIISRFANNMKGSLTESDFLTLLTWINQLPDELKVFVSFRLAGGRHK